MSQATTWLSNVSCPTPDDFTATRRTISMAVIELETIRERVTNVSPPVDAAQVEELGGFIALVELDLRMMLNRFDLLIKVRDDWNGAGAPSPSSGR